MVDREVNRALLNAYRHNIIRYQKLLKTRLTELERNYIKQRLSACQAAIKALIGREAESIELSVGYRGHTGPPADAYQLDR